MWAIQAFVKEFCLPREGGEKTRVQTKAKRWVAELHTLAQPWIRALTRAVRIPALERLADLIQSADEVKADDGQWARPARRSVSVPSPVISAASALDARRSVLPSVSAFVSR